MVADAGTGGCQCGSVRFSVRGEPLALYICHCRECRRQSASAFGMSLEVRRSDLRLEAGAPRFWSRPTDSGRRIACVYCADCGSRLWHESTEPAATVTVKAGALDVPVDASGAIHIWVSRKLPGIVIPADARQFLEEPD